jgi:hypothetical protein
MQLFRLSSPFRLPPIRNSVEMMRLMEARGSPNATQHMALKHQNETANELALKYGSLTIHILRGFYGSFASHCADNERLSEVLADLDPASLTQLVRDYKSGRLEKICQPGRIRVEVVA